MLTPGASPDGAAGPGTDGDERVEPRPSAEVDAHVQTLSTDPTNRTRDRSDGKYHDLVLAVEQSGEAGIRRRDEQHDASVGPRRPEVANDTAEQDHVTNGGGLDRADALPVRRDPAPPAEPARDASHPDGRDAGEAIKCLERLVASVSRQLRGRACGRRFSHRSAILARTLEHRGGAPPLDQ